MVVQHNVESYEIKINRKIVYILHIWKNKIKIWMLKLEMQTKLICSIRNMLLRENCCTAVVHIACVCLCLCLFVNCCIVYTCVVYYMNGFEQIAHAIQSTICTTFAQSHSLLHDMWWWCVYVCVGSAWLYACHWTFWEWRELKIHPPPPHTHTCNQYTHNMPNIARKKRGKTKKEKISTKSSACTENRSATQFFLNMCPVSILV